MAHLGRRAVAVVGQALDQDRDAPWPIALVGDRLDRRRIAARAGAARDRPLDVLLGHAQRLCLLDRIRQRRVAFGVPPAVTCGDGDGAGELREELAPARVDDCLLVLDPRPFGVPGHDP